MSKPHIGWPFQAGNLRPGLEMVIRTAFFSHHKLMGFLGTHVIKVLGQMFRRIAIGDAPKLPAMLSSSWPFGLAREVSLVMVVVVGKH